MKTFKRFALSACMVLGVLAASQSYARDLIYGSWIGAKSTTNTITMTRYFEKIKKDTNGAISFKLLAGGQVATANGTVEAVKNGTIDAGHAIAPYVPATLPATNMIFNTNSLGDDSIAASGALVETMLLHCPQCLEEYRKNNAVSFTGYSTAPYELLCTKPFKTVAELKGVKVRSSAGGIHIMNIAGATPVAMTVPAGVEAMQRGTVDCSWAALSWLTNYGYIDVTKYVLDYPLGMAGPPMPFYLNRKVWESMTPAQRKVLVDNAAFLVATHT
ncbi:MAG: TRAP transporter substrate-binding protein DctP, partial [Burkholderiales bacterium]